MKRLFTLLFALLSVAQISAETQTVTSENFDLYGFVRTDFFYDSRESFAPCNELFYLYPYDERFDPLGEDMNSSSSSGFFAFITRLGLNFEGVKIGNADATAKIEVDFGGFGSNNTILRIRHAYMNLDWRNGNTLLIGQSWHPLFGEVMPYLNNIATGAPFQPFSRSPQVRYQRRMGVLKLTAAALCQFQYASNGVIGASNTYMINSCIPELFAGADLYLGDFAMGVGADLLHIRPRTEGVVNSQSYKVDEMLAMCTGEFHVRYESGLLRVVAKTLYGSGMDSNLMLGGYGVTSESGANGEREYTAFRHSATWMNVTYGKVWRPSLFVGYTKNLGTAEPLMGNDYIYGYGVGSASDSDSNNTAIDQLLGATLGFTYNRPSWSLGLEYSATTAWYGDLNLDNGRVGATHDVTNHRVAAQMSYIF